MVIKRTASPPTSPRGSVLARVVVPGPVLGSKASDLRLPISYEFPLLVRLVLPACYHRNLPGSVVRGCLVWGLVVLAPARTFSIGGLLF